MNRSSLAFQALIISAAAALTACNDAENIGSSLIQSENTIYVEDDFKLTGATAENDRVQSRSSMQLIGAIDAPDYGRFSADFVTQFLPVAEIDTTLRSAAQIDSVKLHMIFKTGSFVGDSVIPMGVETFRLTRQLQAPIFSDFNPADYYNPSAPLGATVYGASYNELPDTLRKLQYREIYVDMPLDLGIELFDIYKKDPSTFLNPQEFAKYFPGMYVKTSYGSGRVTQIGANLITYYYHYNTKNDAGRDTTYNYVGNFFSATPEIISNNIIDYQMSDNLRARIDAGEKLIVAPAGTDVEIKFPLKDVIGRYRDNQGTLSVVNNLTMSIPGEKISNTFGINPPKQLLLVLKKEREKFFEESKVTNNITSFYASYNERNDTYEFSSMRSYFLDALDREGELTPDDYTFVLTPVTVSSELVYDSSVGKEVEYIKDIVPYIEKPAIVRLNLEKAKIILTFSNQTIKN